ncbi:MAG TPA: hypothetical protein VIJ97_04400 [Candidatus Anoxymicrobiaceae bacterium]
MELLTLVAYESESLCTARVAAALFEALPAEKKMRVIEEVDDTRGYDLVFVGLEAGTERSPLEHGPGCELVVFVHHSEVHAESGASWPAPHLFVFEDCEDETLGRAKLFAKQVLEGLQGVKATGCA